MGAGCRLDQTAKNTGRHQPASLLYCKGYKCKQVGNKSSYRYAVQAPVGTHTEEKGLVHGYS